MPPADLAIIKHVEAPLVIVNRGVPCGEPLVHKSCPRCVIAQKQNAGVDAQGVRSGSENNPLPICCIKAAQELMQLDILYITHSMAQCLMSAPISKGHRDPSSCMLPNFDRKSNNRAMQPVSRSNDKQGEGQQIARGNDDNLSFTTLPVVHAAQDCEGSFDMIPEKGLLIQGKGKA